MGNFFVFGRGHPSLIRINNSNCNSTRKLIAETCFIPFVFVTQISFFDIFIPTTSRRRTFHFFAISVRFTTQKTCRLPTNERNIIPLPHPLAQQNYAALNSQSIFFSPDDIIKLSIEKHPSVEHCVYCNPIL